MAVIEQVKPDRYALGGMSSISADKIDRAAGVIRGVCIATAGVPVEGHGYDDEATGEFIQFWTDEETLSTMLDCALAVGEPLKAKLEHKTGLREIIGTYSQWRIEGDKLLADFATAPTCDASTKEHIFWMAETLPNQFGVSVTAAFSKRQVGQTALMRCADLKSADFVDEPAINVSLFSKNAATESPHNPKQKKETMNEEQLKTLKAEIVQELAESNQEAIAEAVKEAVEGAIEEITASQKISAEEKPNGEEEKPVEAEEKSEDKELSAKSIGTAVAKAVRGELVALGLSRGAKVQGEGDRNKPNSETFELAIGKKVSAGKSYHAALKELQAENPSLVELECKRRGKSTWIDL